MQVPPERARGHVYQVTDERDDGKKAPRHHAPARGLPYEASEEARTLTG